MNPTCQDAGLCELHVKGELDLVSEQAGHILFQGASISSGSAAPRGPVGTPVHRQMSS